MQDGATRYHRDGEIAHVTFDRPQARNAMTWAMYDDLAALCDNVNAEDGPKVVIFRGAGGKAFIAGTDISQFATFRSGEDGIAYEERIEAVLSAMEAIRVPTIAVIDGWCVGGGLAIAACCDIRIGTPSAQFGVPIARTLGNCLSVENHARLVAELGPARTKRMLLLGEMLSAEEALAGGFLSAVVPPEELAGLAEDMARRLAGHAPLTMRVTKEAIRRLRTAGIDGDDLVRLCYGSEDFRNGVAAFVAKRPATWLGR